MNWMHEAAQEIVRSQPNLEVNEVVLIIKKHANDHAAETQASYEDRIDRDSIIITQDNSDGTRRQGLRGMQRDD